MDYVHLGSSGLKVSRLCLGTMTFGSRKWRPWVLEQEDALPFYRRAIEAGVNFFDTADVYSLGVSEEITGRALKEFGPSRDKLVIATKVNSPMGSGPNERGLSRKHILHSIDESLRRLQTDYVDLYQIHRFDSNTPVEETLEALDHVVRAGKALYIGASSMYAWQFLKMLNASDRLGLSRFVSMQNHYNLVYREEEREMIPLCVDQGIGVIPWSPLARGFLAGNRSVEDRGKEQGATLRAQTDDFARHLYYRDSDFAVVERLSQVAKKHGVENAQVALAWLLSKSPVAAPIIGASKLPHLESALTALDLKLEPSDIQALEEPYQAHPMLGL